MDDRIKFIISRRSVRKFTDSAVSNEEITQIADCALYAPTGHNNQETRFFVIKDKAVLKKLSKIVRDAFYKMPIDENNFYNTAILKAHNDPGYDYSFHAPLVIIVAAPAESPNGMANSANAVENMYLAAAALGLGACWVNQLHWLTREASLREFLYKFGLRKDEDIYASIAIGHPAQPLPAPSPRKENRVIYV